MPYKLRKAPKRDLYWVVSTETGKKHSKDPLPKARAEAQMRALYLAMRLEGGGARPDNNTLQQVAQQAYKNPPQSQIGEYKLVSHTPSLKFYMSGNTVLVGIRGTKTQEDWTDANSRLPLNQLESSDRFKNDLQTLKEFQSRFPMSQYDYYGAGHSLGGAILDEFLSLGLLKSGLSYNPAVQPKNFSNKDIQNDRIYAENDPLYQLESGFLAKKPEVRKAKRSLTQKLISYIPYAGKAYDYFYGHKLNQFEGGTHRQNFLKAHKLEDKSYNLKELSKISAVPMMILQAVYDRGIGAYKTNPSSVRLKGSYVKGVNAPMSKKLSKEQWAMARVYSFLDGNPKHDNDLRGGAWYDIFRPSRVINEFVNPDSLARRRISDVFSGIRTNLPPSARRTMEEYGNEYIQSLMIRRDPIQSALNTVFEVITLGQWSKAKSAEQYDKLFHLGLVLTLASGKQILIEKNEVINIGKPKPLQPDSEVLELPPLPTPTTLNQFIANGAAVKGDDFYRYDPFANNCQDFVAILLKANNHYPPQAVKFVKQPVESLVKKLPQWTHPVAKGITDLGAIANVALEGAGHAKFMTQLNKAGLNPSVYLKKAQKKAKDAGYGKGAKLLGFATDGVHKLAMPNEDGKMIVFGRVGYGDHLIYSHLESAGKVPQGTASKKQSVFQKSHSQIRGDWKSNPFSPNNLALKILW